MENNTNSDLQIPMTSAMDAWGNVGQLSTEKRLCECELRLLLFNGYKFELRR